MRTFELLLRWWVVMRTVRSRGEGGPRAEVRRVGDVPVVGGTGVGVGSESRGNGADVSVSIEIDTNAGCERARESEAPLLLLSKEGVEKSALIYGGKGGWREGAGEGRTRGTEVFFAQNFGRSFAPLEQTETTLNELGTNAPVEGFDFTAAHAATHKGAAMKTNHIDSGMSSESQPPQSTRTPTHPAVLSRLIVQNMSKEPVRGLKGSISRSLEGLRRVLSL